MEQLFEMFLRGLGEMIDRFSGPLNFRLVIMPLVVTAFAVRSGIRDARQGKRAFLGALLFETGQRITALRSALKDVGKVFIMALIMDTIYQLLVLPSFYPVQLLAVAWSCAIVPYLIARSPTTLIARAYYRNHRKRAPLGGVS
jgi:hypothetical protein